MASEMAAKGLGRLAPAAPKMGGAKPLQPKPSGKMGEEPKHESGGAIELHDHGNGTAHTVIGGKQEEHPDHMHAVAHIAHHVMPEGSHFHAHHDGFSMQSHGVHESGEHVPTQEHNSPEEMHSAMDQMMGEGSGGQGGQEEAGGGESGLGEFQG